MKLIRLVPAALALVALPMFATHSQAQPRRVAVGGFREGYEFTVTLNQNTFGDSMELQNDTGAGFRFGYLFNPHHEIEFMANGVTADDSDQVNFPGETADITNIQVIATGRGIRRLKHLQKTVWRQALAKTQGECDRSTCERVASAS